MLHRKTDNSPVTDESLAGVRDEIAEAYSHASPDTITLDVTTYPAALYAAHEELNRLRSQFDGSVALLREALRNCINHAGPCAGSTTGECDVDGWLEDGLCPSCAVTEIASLALALADGAE